MFTCDLFWNYPLKRNICGKVNPSCCWRMVESGRPTLHIVRRREQATQEAEREREREWGGRAWRELFTLDSWLLKCKDLDQIQIGTQAFNKKFRVWQIYSKVYTFPRCYRMNHNSVNWVTNVCTVYRKFSLESCWTDLRMSHADLCLFKRIRINIQLFLLVDSGPKRFNNKLTAYRKNQKFF